jgi:hypothetical protein
MKDEYGIEVPALPRWMRRLDAVCLCRGGGFHGGMGQLKGAVERQKNAGLATSQMIQRANATSNATSRTQVSPEQGLVAEETRAAESQPLAFTADQATGTPRRRRRGLQSILTGDTSTGGLATLG